MFRVQRYKSLEREKLLHCLRRLPIGMTGGMTNSVTTSRFSFVHSYSRYCMLKVSISPRCFCKNCGFIVKKLCMLQCFFYSKYRSSLATIFSHLSGSIRIPRRNRSRHLLKSLSTNRAIFWYLRTKRTCAARTGPRVASIGTSGN